MTAERQRQWRKNGAQLQRVIDDFSTTTQYLASVLVEKDLFERQSSVLESIILSHEKVSQWKEFVQQILSGFHAIFPFNFFFIAFAEQNELSLYFYYLAITATRFAAWCAAEPRRICCGNWPCPTTPR
ncbi:hypothetical protein [Methylomonas koyamae]|uniref:hypothetical protein n=1 Tax=Methylomonas koyamae TaxID=702114 RepID=UPI000B1239FC|nr:hypothetical protein [Methylomonas koyamae]